MLLSFADAEPLAGELAAALDCPAAQIAVHRFPDGESRVRLPAQLPERVILCRSLDDPNARLVELMLAAQTARDLGARHITLVAPYLCYMRQDIAFHPGEAVSQRIIGAFLARYVDALITVDPHLHRTASLHEAVPVARAIAVSAAPLMGEFLASRGARVLLMGPDEESEQWVSIAAQRAGLDFAVARKTRHGDRDVSIALPPHDYTDTAVVLVDDVASSGRTLAQAAIALREAGARSVDALVTHALFAGDSIDTMRAAGIADIWSSNSIRHASNAFSLASALAEACSSATRSGDS
jgi:ribose-phosphate pyrophosphokinase